MMRYLALFVFTIFYSAAFATNEPLSVIKGTVYSSDNQPVANATVHVKNTNRTTITDKNGVFYFRKLDAGTYTIEVSFVGSESVEQEVEVGNNETADISITINSSLKDLEEVIIKGSRNKYKNDEVSSTLRLQTPILELPQNIQVISSQIMADQQVFDIVDGITRNISGATRQGHWDNQYANIRMRGSKIPAFRNGMNIEASWGPTAEDASMIERIEFVKGPAGFMLANGEPGGFYNVVTKKPTGYTKGSATLSMGSFSTYRGALDFDGKLSKDGRLLYRLNMAGQQKDFHTKYNYSNRYVVAPVLSYLIDDATTLTLEYTYQGSKYLSNGNYSFSPKQFADPGIGNDFFYGDPTFEPSKLRDHSVYIYLDHKLNERWTAHAQAAYFNFNMEANSTWLSYMRANGDMPRYWSISGEAGENRFGQFSFTGEERTGNIRHRILAGADFGNKKFWGDFRTLLDSIPAQPLNVYNPIYGLPGSIFPVLDRSQDVRVLAGGSNYVTSVSYASAYAQDELAFFDDQLRLSLGLRFTSAETVGKTKAAQINSNVFSPRVGLSYSITDNMSAYALYDQSFVPVAGTNWQGEAFKPIRGNDIEAGIKKDWFNGHWSSTLSAYIITRKNALVADPDPDHIVGGQTFQAQLGETKTKGIEVDITGEVVRGLNLNANYALTDSKISEDSKEENIGNVTPNTAKHTANGWLNYRFQTGALEGFGLMGGVSAQIDRYIGNTKESNFPNYFRADGGISYQKGRYSISMLVNNLLNHQRLLTAGSVSNPSAALAAKGAVTYYSYIVEARRNMRIGITYRF
ncbi:TonB-dependent receptor [Niabella ginsengisoli]|uniref:TonB-dependent receptor n=1 Tax=Niabella ginsengisoli TaxID=522298 RepID=A0ABS9SMJ8_9BACT|nr:TonB-dependent receptor [Niabella ginsengisoli]MCH5599608.1 TonB-dependent receptor [Niabella ginsengisoli]